MQDWVIYLASAVVFVLLGWAMLKMLSGLWKAKRLMDRFGNEEFVETILDGKIARGMSYEMVVAAWGEPADLDETVMKTKTKREMKYDQKGKNRFGTRVYLEDGVVVGWETK